MKKIICFICCMMIVSFMGNHTFAQDVTFFFEAGDISGEPDRFGNTHSVGPEDAIDPRPFGNEDLEDVFFDEDGLWLIYNVEGNIFLVSHGPGFFEDAPEITMEIIVKYGGRYEVILNYLDSEGVPDSGPIMAALGDEELMMYSASNGNRATGGTSPGYPTIGNTTAGSMFWYSVSLGEVEVAAGDTVSVRVDDVQGDTLDLLPPPEVTSTFQGVTLRVLELEGTLPEIQVSPGATELTTDISGNQFRTWPVDEATYPNQEDWLTITTREDGSGKWNIRQGLGPYGPILESFPTANDAMPLRTTITFAGGGTYNMYLNVGDTGAANPTENDDVPNPLQFAPEGEELMTYVPNDGTFNGTPGYNDYEVLIGQITVEAGETRSYIIDDAPDYPNVSRSVYLGMRFEIADGTAVHGWSLY